MFRVISWILRTKTVANECQGARLWLYHAVILQLAALLYCFKEQGGYRVIQNCMIGYDANANTSRRSLLIKIDKGTITIIKISSFSIILNFQNGTGFLTYQSLYHYFAKDVD